MILAIDPSVNNIGVCIYDSVTEEFAWKLFHPQGTTLPKKLEHFRRHLTTWIWGKMGKPLTSYMNGITHLVCEYPQHFNSQKGAIAEKMGWTLDLACVCGFIAGICKLANVHYFTPIKWKGNLTKHAIEHRFKRRFPDELLPSEHEQEATMLMLYFLEDCK